MDLCRDNKYESGDAMLMTFISLKFNLGHFFIVNNC